MNNNQKQTAYTALSAALSAGTFLALSTAIGYRAALTAAPVLLLIPVCVFLLLREKKFDCPPETLLNETPSVVGMMSVVLSAGGSFDTAVRDVAAHGPKNMAAIFRKIVMDADCRQIPDIKAEVLRAVSSFPAELSPFRRAIHIIATAFESSDEKEKAKMMKDAENIVLTGLKEMGSSYSAKLNSPCMLIFGLGIMVPMILISILPMLSMSGTFAVSIVNSEMVTLIVLVLIPAAVAGIVVSMRGKNPFFKMEFRCNDLKYALPLILAVPLYFLCTRLGISANGSLICSLAAGGLAAAAFMAPAVAEERKRGRTEEMLKDALFELGNRLSMGENFDTAITKALSSGKDGAEMAQKLEREIVLCRGDTESAVRAVLGPVSKLISGFYCDVCRASKRDIRDAGRLASSIAHQLQDQNSVRKDIENRLKSMLEMMTGTSAVFAPLILGMSVVMLGPISDITGAVFFDDIGLTLTVYLVELAALIAFLSSNLMCKGRFLDVMQRFCFMMPVALAVFAACSSLTI